MNAEKQWKHGESFGESATVADTQKFQSRGDGRAASLAQTWPPT